MPSIFICVFLLLHCMESETVINYLPWPIFSSGSILLLGITSLLSLQKVLVELLNSTSQLNCSHDWICDQGWVHHNGHTLDRKCWVLLPLLVISIPSDTLSSSLIILLVLPLCWPVLSFVTGVCLLCRITDGKNYYWRLFPQNSCR